METPVASSSAIVAAIAATSTPPPPAKKVKLETDQTGKLLLTAVQPVVTSVSSPLVSSVISSGTTTAAAPTVLNFTFANGELRPCAGPIGAQMTVTSNMRSEGVQNPALPKPIIVTLSGLQAVQGKQQHLTVPSSSVLAQPLQTVTSTDKLQLTPTLTPTSAASILSALSSALPNSSASTPIPIVVAAAPPGLAKGGIGTSGILSVTPITSSQLQSVSASTSSASNAPAVTVSTPIMISQAPLLHSPLLGSFLGNALSTGTETIKSTVENTCTTTTTTTTTINNNNNNNSGINNNSNNSKADPTSPDYDPIQAMDWKDGIATLPGSNIKFKLNEFGTLEVITEASSILNDLACNNGTSGTEKNGTSESSFSNAESSVVVKEEPKSTATTTRNPGGLEKAVPCENCGCLGRREDFVGDKNRFCSQTCVSVNSTRKIVSQRQKDMLLRKRRRKMLKLQSNVTHAPVTTHSKPMAPILAAVSIAPITSFTTPAASSQTTSTTVPSTLVTTLTTPIASIVPRNPVQSHDSNTNTMSGSPPSTPVDEVSKTRLDENVCSPGGKNKKPNKFSWFQYLEQEKAEAAAPKAFRENQSFPVTRNCFKPGMKLEGIDPRHPSLFCVLSVAEVMGIRLRLHFDGYSDCYDFWVNADSIDIFPVGFCEKTGRVLQPPKGYTLHEFDWTKYLQSSKAAAAPKHIFCYRNSQSITPHGFRVGMKLEAVDKKNSSLVCVATVTDVLDNRFLVHFDGWEDMYDYWVEPNSPYIHPINWCLEHGHALTPPNNYKDPDKFSWTRYLTETKSQAAPARSFKQRPANSFKANTKLEAVDRRNPMLIRVATIADVKPNSIKIHFDGWSDAYDYWVDDDLPDIHPINWCYKTLHLLQPPINAREVGTENGGCPTPGCRGVGHIKGPKYTTHHSAFGCPYSYANMNKEMTLQDRTGTARQESLVLTVIPAPSDVSVSTTASLTPTASAANGDPLAGRKTESNVSESLRRCPTPGCNGSGHVTGKYTVHHRISGCPLAASKREAAERANGLSICPVRSTRGRKRTKFPLTTLHLKGKETSYNEGSVASSPSSVASSQHSEDSKPVMVKESLQNSIHRSVFSGQPGSAPPPPADKEMPYRWDQHSQLLPGVIQISGSSVCKWTIDNVASFITSLTGCAEQGKIFRDEQIDGEAFLLLNQADIVKILCVKLGPALKIFNSILLFRKTIDC